jgi:hypothetical protein
MTLPTKCDEKKINHIIGSLFPELKPYYADSFTMPPPSPAQLKSHIDFLAKRRLPPPKNTHPMPSYLISFAIAEKDVEVLREVQFGKNIIGSKIVDHETAEVAREFCRSTAAKVAIAVLPHLPWFAIDHVSIYFHYDPCLPDVTFTRRLYTVSIYMDKIRSLRLKELNEKNIRNYFEMENSQIFGLFHRWKARGVLMRPDVNEMI